MSQNKEKLKDQIQACKNRQDFISRDLEDLFDKLRYVKDKIAFQNKDLTEVNMVLLALEMQLTKLEEEENEK